MRFTVEVKNESGYNEAIEGISYSYNATWERAEVVSKKLAFKDGGENKFLESIAVWLEVNAPRYWWQEADTYRVGSTKQSASTMHTLKKGYLEQEDFVQDIRPEFLKFFNDMIANEDLRICKSHLPEGFLQKRMWVVNYKTLRNIILQRRNHRLEEWKVFVKTILEEVYHPELLPGLTKEIDVVRRNP